MLINRNNHIKMIKQKTLYLKLQIKIFKMIHRKQSLRLKTIMNKNKKTLIISHSTEAKMKIQINAITNQNNHNNRRMLITINYKIRKII